jgi:hypothetical protein
MCRCGCIAGVDHITDIGEALAADEELGIDYFSFTVADGSRATPSLRRVMTA